MEIVGMGVEIKGCEAKQEKRQKPSEKNGGSGEKEVKKTRQNETFPSASVEQTAFADLRPLSFNLLENDCQAIKDNFCPEISISQASNLHDSYHRP